MKTLFKNILVFAVMLGTYTSYANTTLEAVPSFNNVRKGNSITVTDAEGAIVFSGLVNFDGDINTLYDFSQLHDGVYVIEINKAFEIEVNTVEIKDHQVSFIDQKSEKIFKPVFRIENDRVIISKLALNTNEMEVQLYFGNELILNETVNGAEIINRVYKLDKKIKGDYTAVVKSNDRQYVETFRL